MFTKRLIPLAIASLLAVGSVHATVWTVTTTGHLDEGTFRGNGSFIDLTNQAYTLSVTTDTAYFSNSYTDSASVSRSGDYSPFNVSFTVAGSTYNFAVSAGNAQSHLHTLAAVGGYDQAFLLGSGYTGDGYVSAYNYMVNYSAGLTLDFAQNYAVTTPFNGYGVAYVYGFISSSGLQFYGHDTNADTVTINSASAVPETETYAMLLAGLGLMGAVARRRKTQQA